eukprot:PhF_6_TR35054/c0_g1_i1/m.51077
MSKQFDFVKSGYLNMVVLRNQRDCERIPTESFLNNDAILRASTLDSITFRDNTVFKFTLEFRKPIPCVEETAVRENTDWVLASCPGHLAQYNKVEERLVLQNCSVSISSTIEPLLEPFCVSMRLDPEKGEWLLDLIWR